MDRRETVLRVDDDEITCRCMRLLLEKRGYDVEAARTGQKALEKARMKFFSVALLEISLPDVGGIELVTSLKELHPDTEIIIITAHASPEDTMRALNEGASACITKPLNIDEVLVAVGNVLEKQRLIARKRQAKEALSESESRYRSLFEDSPISLWEVDVSAAKGYIDILRNSGVRNLRAYLQSNPEHLSNCAISIKIVDVNKATLDLYKARDIEDFQRGLIPVFGERLHNPFTELLVSIAEGKTAFESEVTTYTLTGDARQVVARWTVAPGHEETLSKVYLSIIDITERKRAEKPLREFEKMEALGTLANGVALDFNSLVRSIRGNANLALMKVPKDSAAYPYLSHIGEASIRAANVTSQLLLFSQHQPLTFEELDLNKVILNSVRILNRLIGEQYAIIKESGAHLWPINADTSHIEQVIMNMVINAKDGMPEGGQIAVKTENVHVDRRYCKTHEHARPGRFVCLSIKDNGVGMDSAAMSRVFEPFLGSERPADATCLGLSVVYGIVKKHGGWIDVESQPEQGSVFRIYFPGASAVAEEEQKKGRSNRCVSRQGRESLACGE